MKILTTLTTLFLSCALMAENNGQQANQGFLNAAKEYDAKAESASQNGNSHNAEIFTKLAAIKREAAVSTNGYDWAEYHKLSGQLNSAKKKPQKNHSKKKQNGFEDAAQRYDQLAKKAIEAGNPEQAASYTRLAAIKREAQKAGGNYDWSEYHKISSNLHKGKKGKKVGKHEKSPKKAPTKKDVTKKPTTNKHTPPTNFITTAQKHAALANKSNAAKDDYSAQIHTRLAAILIDAAAKQSENRTIDWTEYKDLKELLGK